ncbi:MAG: STAS domain-containing protein [Candidatus Ozemobacteraceae bacterium]
MDFEVVTREDRCIVCCGKEVTISNSSDFTGVIAEQVKSGKKLVVIDFTKTSFIDSSGLGAIIANISEIQNRKIQLIFGGCNSIIRKVLELVGLNRIFPVLTTMEEADKIR